MLTCGAGGLRTCSTRRHRGTGRTVLSLKLFLGRHQASISLLFTCGSRRAKNPCHRHGTGLNNYPGDVLLSQGAAPQVPSALVVLTSVFGMGTGVAPPLWSPGTLLYFS
jgi:hypothetical protein